MTIPTERVITEVQSHPILWDITLDLYKSRDARQTAWLEICDNIVENFQSLNREEKKIVEQKIQQRWKTARDCYVKGKAIKKKINSGLDIKKSKLYIHYDMMTFLDRNMDLNADESFHSQEESTSGTSMDGNSHLQEINKPGTSMDVKFPLQEQNKPDISMHENSNFSQAFVSTTAANKGKKRKRRDTDFEKEILSYVKKSLENLQDDDWAFFHSIMPTIKEFTTNQKLMFRTKILNCLMEEISK